MVSNEESLLELSFIAKLKATYFQSGSNISVVCWIKRKVLNTSKLTIVIAETKVEKGISKTENVLRHF